MKTKIINPILLPVFIDSCSSATQSQLNTGAGTECLEGVTTRLALAKTLHRFTDLDDFKLQATWDTAIESKDIVPLYGVYEVASANVEAVKYESGNFSAVTKNEIKKMTSESYLSICSHKALKSYENSGYTQVYEITENGEILGVYDSDGIQVKGQDITEFEVAIRERAVNDKVPYSMVTITFRDFNEFEDNGIIIKPSWDANVLNGIFEVSLEIVSASATEIVVSATLGCGSEPAVSLELAYWDLATTQTIDSSTYDALTEHYTLGGVALVSGTLSSGGVKDVGDYKGESAGVAVTVV
ncbi:MAG: hypothetical protein DRQ45_00605 [Gammaproteobacteria bacterium]|nr:MAG: hypothetical protein DRQ45_00605 [Gammaproteobacteria bacterium]